MKGVRHIERPTFLTSLTPSKNFSVPHLLLSELNVTKNHFVSQNFTESYNDEFSFFSMEPNYTTLGNLLTTSARLY